MLITAGGGLDALLRHQVNGVLQGVYKKADVPHHGDGAAAGAWPVGRGQHLVNEFVRLAHAEFIARHFFQRGGAAAFRQAQGCAGVALGQVVSRAKLLLFRRKSQQAQLVGKGRLA